MFSTLHNMSNEYISNTFSCAWEYDIYKQLIYPYAICHKKTKHDQYK